MTINQIFEIYKKHPVVTTDSRNCPENSIFIALKGDNFDGNKFASQAIGSGCAYAIIDDKNYLVDNDERYIVVENALQTYKDLARLHRRQFDIPVIGITGTNGKTTTKELIAAVLRKRYNVMATEGNFNNDVGVPKTLMRIDDKTEVAIIEMGASHIGDIKTLAATAEPTHGLITNVGEAHLQGFGSLKGVIKTKGELYKYLSSRQEATIFINADDDNLLEILPDNVWVTPYSTNQENEEDCIIGRVEEANPLLTVAWHEPTSQLAERNEQLVWHTIHTKLIGTYNINNILAAVAVGINFGIEPEKICEAIEEYSPTNNRSQLVKTANNTLIVDAYNANPSSMIAALDNFAEIKADNKLLIIGQMNELGETSDELHRRIVNHIRQLSAANNQTTNIKVWLVGKNFAPIKCHYKKFDDAEAVKKAIAEEQPTNYTILIKGSNSMRLSGLVDFL